MPGTQRRALFLQLPPLPLCRLSQQQEEQVPAQMPTTAPLGQTPRHPSTPQLLFSIPRFLILFQAQRQGPGLGGAATAVHTGQAPVSTPPPKMPPNMRVCQSFWNNTSWRGNRFSSKGTAEALCACTVRSWLAGGHCVRRAVETQPQVWEGEGGAAAGKAESVQGAEIPSLPTGSPSSPAESQARTCWYWEPDAAVGGGEASEPLGRACQRPVWKARQGFPTFGENFKRNTETNTVPTPLSIPASC